MKYIVQHGSTPLTAWFLKAPQAWTGDFDQATRFDTQEEAQAAQDHAIAQRYPSSMFSKSQIKDLVSRCSIITVPA